MKPAPVSVWQGLSGSSGPSGALIQSIALRERRGKRRPDDDADAMDAAGSLDTPVNVSAPYAWEFLLLVNKTELGRNDYKARAGDKFLHCSAPKRPRVPRQQMDEHRKAMYKARRGDIVGALHLLGKGAARFPDNPFFPSSAAALYAKQGRHKQAALQFEHTLEIDPDNSVAMQGLARMLALHGDVSAARRLFERACEVRGSHVAFP